MRTRLLSALGLLSLASGGGARAQDESDRPAALEWNQPRGNAAGTSALELAPVESVPLRLWAVALESVPCEPVTWAGAVYTVDGDGRKRKLRAWSLEDGSPLGSATIPDEGPTWLAAWNGTVAVVTREKTTLFQHKGSSLRRQKSADAGALHPPCVYGGWLLAADGARVRAMEMRTGNVQELFEAGPYRPAVIPGAASGSARIASARHLARENYQGIFLVLETHVLTDLDERKLGVDLDGSHYGSTFEGNPGTGSGSVTALAPGWFILSADPLRTSERPSHGSLLPQGRMFPMASASAVAARAGRLFGFTDKGDLLVVQGDGTYARLLPAGIGPPGATTGPVSMARQVLYLGNWAVDTEDGRVLWSLPELEPATHLIPVAGGRVLLATAQNELVCLGNSASAGPEGASSETHVAGPAPTAPGSGPGVVLENGQRVAGAVKVMGETVRVASDPPLEVPLPRVALLEDGEETRLVGEEQAVWLAWWDFLRLAWLARLEEVFASYRSGGHLADCQRLLLEAADYEPEADWLDALGRTLTGKAPNRNANAEQQRARVEREEAQARSESAGALESAAEWCRLQGLDGASTRLLAWLERLQPGTDVSERVASLVPADFPWKDAPEAARTWMRFAEELLPAGAAFVDLGAELTHRGRAGTAAEFWGAGHALRSTNLLLFTREDQPEVLGACLRNGEGVLRVLSEVFGVPPSADGLEVHLHLDREAYLKEESHGQGAPEWSVGHYRPDEKLCSFYVPRDDSGVFQERSLTQVLVHELTHQFLAERWPQGGSAARADQPGFWMLEGVAGFFDGQVVDLGRRRRGIDDVRVHAIDTSAQLAAGEHLLPLERFMTLRQAEFARLSDAPAHRLLLRHTLATVTLSERGAFYAQAASLFFHLFHARGESGRAALLELLAAVYQNRCPEDPWRALGFESAAELERGYHAFLAESVR